MKAGRDTAKRGIDRWSILFLTIMLVSWFGAARFLLLAMGGGFLGLFLSWCLGILLLVPIGFLIRDLIARGPRKLGALVLENFTLAGLVLLSFFQIRNLAMTWYANPIHDLGGLPSESQYTRTRFEFQKGLSHFVIRDSGNRLRFCFGAVPVSIRVEGDERIVVFDDWVILKSWTFDYGFEGKAINFGGWMGAGSNEPELEIGPEGLPMPKR